MKLLLSAAAIAAVVALAGPASAQTQPPMYPQPVPSWMQDNGGTTDHPIHMPGDNSANALNRQYLGGISVPPPNGFPAPYYVPR